MSCSSRTSCARSSPSPIASPCCAAVGSSTTQPIGGLDPDHLAELMIGHVDADDVDVAPAVGVVIEGPSSAAARGCAGGCRSVFEIRQVTLERDGVRRLDDVSIVVAAGRDRRRRRRQRQRSDRTRRRAVRHRRADVRNHHRRWRRRHSRRSGRAHSGRARADHRGSPRQRHPRIDRRAEPRARGPRPLPALRIHAAQSGSSSTPAG